MNLFYENCGGLIVEVVIGLLLILNYIEYKRLSAIRTTSFRFLLLEFIYVCMVPFVFIPLPLFAIYRFVVNIYLSMIYGSKYGGLLEYGDVFFSLESKTPITVVYMVQYKKNNLKPFYNFVKEKIRKPLLTKFKDDPKSFAVVQKYLGYLYILKDEVQFEDCVRKLDRINTSEKLSKADLSKLISIKLDVSLPKNPKALWEVLIGTQPIAWKREIQDESIEFYPVVVRISHILGDALHAFRGVMELIADKDIHCANIDIEKLSKLPSITPTTITLMKLWHYIKCAYALIVFPAVFLIISILTKTEETLLHGPQLTNQIIRCLNVEESPVYVQRVKKIKKHFPGSSFEDILLAAFTATLAEYYRKNSARIPEYLLTTTSVTPQVVEFVMSSINKAKDRKITCKNQALLTVRKLPIGISPEDGEINLNKLIECIQKERTGTKNSIEIELLSVLQKVYLRLLPVPIIAMFLKKLDNYPVAVSNIPGPPCVTVLGGCHLQDIIGFHNHGRRRGIGFSIVSYDARLQLGFSVDKALISNPKDVQAILDGVYKYVDLLDKQIN